MKQIHSSMQGAGAILLIALAYFFDNSGTITALLPAVAVHEMGHLVALIISGARIQGLRIAFAGLELEYRGQLNRKGRALSLAAGPAVGGVYAFLCLCSDLPFLRLSGTISAALTAFNLLPALPLDGGRLLLEFCGIRAAGRCSLVVAAALLFLGTLLLIRLGAYAMLGMGIWLLLYHGIVR